MAAPREIFAYNLRRLRQATGISQEELAERAGLHRTYVSAVERGKQNISLDNIYSLAQALRIEPAELLSPLSEPFREEED